MVDKVSVKVGRVSACLAARRSTLAELWIMDRVPRLSPPHHFPVDPSPSEIADEAGTAIEYGATMLRLWRPGDDKHEALTVLANGFRQWQAYERAVLAWAGPVDWVQVAYDHQSEREKTYEGYDPDYVGVFPPDPADQAPHGPTTEVPELPPLPPLPWMKDPSLEQWCTQVAELVEDAKWEMANYEEGRDRTAVLRAQATAFRALQPWEQFVIEWAGPVDWAALALEYTIRQEIELELDDENYISPILHPEVGGDAPATPEAPPAPEQGPAKPSRGFDFGF